MGPLYDGPNPLPCHWQEVKTLNSDTKEIQSKWGALTAPNKIEIQSSHILQASSGIPS